jgi:hypothetical protein
MCRSATKGMKKAPFYGANPDYIKAFNKAGTFCKKPFEYAGPNKGQGECQE